MGIFQSLGQHAKDIALLPEVIGAFSEIVGQVYGIAAGGGAVGTQKQVSVQLGGVTISGTATVVEPGTELKLSPFSELFDSLFSLAESGTGVVTFSVQVGQCKVVAPVSIVE